MPTNKKKRLPKITHGQLIKLISQEYVLSEAAVRTVLRGLNNIVLRELANGNVVEVKGFGNFYPSEKRVTANWLPEGHRDMHRTTINPRFSASPVFRNKLQALTGHKLSTFHQPVEVYTAKREDPTTPLQLNQIQPPTPAPSAFD